MGFFSGTSTKTTTQDVDMGPAKFQLPYLQDSFNAARDIYNNSRGSSWFQGDLFAGMNRDQLNDLETMRGFGMGDAVSGGRSIMGMGQQGLGQFGQSINDLNTASGRINSDGTAEIINNANRFVDNNMLDSQINAVGRDINRNLSENILPSIDRSASATGNINSSRAGIAAGVALRGEQDRLASISANMRSQALDRGLSMAQGNRQFDIGANMNLAGARANMANQGVSAMGSGVGMAGMGFNMANEANAREQANRQGMLDQDFARWTGEDNRQMDLLGRYHSIVGGNNWGQSGTTKTTEKTPNGGIFGKLVGGAMSGLGLAKGFGLMK